MLSIGEPGIQIKMDDPALQAYIQRHPFASGPDEEMNQLGRAAAKEGMYFRELGQSVVPRLLTAEETTLSSVEEARLQALFTRIGMTEADQQVHRGDFGWEANLVSRGAKNVLVIGCGDGVELLFLRAILPEAQITALDYHRSLLPGLFEAVGMTFLEGDMHVQLKGLNCEYDLVSSNHTLEHMYDPDRTLSLLAALVVSGGTVASTLPLMGLNGSPYLERVCKFTGGNKAHLPMMDLVYFDMGHPWKTNPADISATLIRAGFVDVRIFQRRDHVCRPTPGSAEEIARKRKVWMLLNTVFLAPIHGVAKLLFPRDVPLGVRRFILALERRLPFGTNRVMNSFSEEASFLCRKP